MHATLFDDQPEEPAAESQLLAALRAMVAHGENVNRAFYGDGTPKAMRAAMLGHKELLNQARAAIAAATAKEAAQ